MKYLLMIYGNRELWESFPSDEWREHIAAQDAFNEEFQQTGELLGAYGLADVVQAKSPTAVSSTTSVATRPAVGGRRRRRRWTSFSRRRPMTSPCVLTTTR
jgi:hypothetical protein